MKLNGKRIMIPAGEGFDERELFYPYYRLIEEGAEVILAGITGGPVSGKKGYVVETTEIKGMYPSDFDGIVIPGGFAPDKLRMSEPMVEFVKSINYAGKPVAAICHGGWLLAEADIIKGKTITSYPSIRTDLTNAGAVWVDKQVVVDGNLVTSRTPDDLPFFMAEYIKLLA